MPALNRYGHVPKDLVHMCGESRRREVGFCPLHDRLDTTMPGGRLVFRVFALLAEFIRELIELAAGPLPLDSGGTSPAGG